LQVIERGFSPVLTLSRMAWLTSMSLDRSRRRGDDARDNERPVAVLIRMQERNTAPP
jgi:hypothetical protein